MLRMNLSSLSVGSSNRRVGKVEGDTTLGMCQISRLAPYILGKRRTSGDKKMIPVYIPSVDTRS